MKATSVMLMLVSLLTFTAAAETLPLDRQLDSVHQTLLELPASVRNARMREVYEADLRVRALRRSCNRVQVADVRELYDATRLLDFYRGDPELLRRMTCFIERLEQAGTAMPRDYLQLHGALLAHRRFADANALRSRRLLEVDALPRLSGARTRARQVLQLDGDRLARRRDLPTSGWRVIAIVHPWCGFSSRAVAALAEDPAWADLRPALQLVVPDAPDWPAQDMLAWNHAHPDLPMQPMLGSKAWNVLDVSSTPTFHLMHDGLLVESRSGWRGDGAELLPLLQRMKNAE